MFFDFSLFRLVSFAADPKIGCEGDYIPTGLIVVAVSAKLFGRSRCDCAICVENEYEESWTP